MDHKFHRPVVAIKSFILPRGRSTSVRNLPFDTVSLPKIKNSLRALLPWNGPTGISNSAPLHGYLYKGIRKLSLSTSERRFYPLRGGGTVYSVVPVCVNKSLLGLLQGHLIICWKYGDRVRSNRIMQCISGY